AGRRVARIERARVAVVAVEGDVVAAHRLVADVERASIVVVAAQRNGHADAHCSVHDALLVAVADGTVVRTERPLRACLVLALEDDAGAGARRAALTVLGALAEDSRRRTHR